LLGIAEREKRLEWNLEPPVAVTCGEGGKARRQVFPDSGSVGGQELRLAAEPGRSNRPTGGTGRGKGVPTISEEKPTEREVAKEIGRKLVPCRHLGIVGDPQQAVRSQFSGRAPVDGIAGKAQSSLRDMQRGPLTVVGGGRRSHVNLVAANQGSPHGPIHIRFTQEVGGVEVFASAQ